MRSLAANTLLIFVSLFVYHQYFQEKDTQTFTTNNGHAEPISQAGYAQKHELEALANQIRKVEQMLDGLSQESDKINMTESPNAGYRTSTPPEHELASEAGKVSHFPETQIEATRKIANRLQHLNEQYYDESIDTEWANMLELNYMELSTKHMQSGDLEFGSFNCKTSLCKLEIYNADFLGREWSSFFTEFESKMNELSTEKSWSMELAELSHLEGEGVSQNIEIFYRKKNL